jgi:catalase
VLAAQLLAQTETRSFTGDDGLLLAKLAGEAQANRRGNALRRGERPVHTYGVMLRGQFTPRGGHGGAAPAHLTADVSVPVIARFSTCDAHQERDDRHRLPVGLAVRFPLPGGAFTDLVAMSTDRFPVTDLEAFVAVSHVLSTPKVLQLGPFLWRSALRQFRSPITFLRQSSPASYACCDYYAIHTFVWTADGDRHPVRYRWKACADRRRLWPWTRRVKPRNYLTQELYGRVGPQSPVTFSLEVQHADQVAPERLRDVGRPLPENVTWEPAGTLELHGIIEPDEEFSEIVFSPAHLPAGVEPFPGDEVFAMRAAAYPASHAFRNGGVP